MSLIWKRFEPRPYKLIRSQGAWLTEAHIVFIQFFSENFNTSVKLKIETGGFEPTAPLPWSNQANDFTTAA